MTTLSLGPLVRQPHEEKIIFALSRVVPKRNNQRLQNGLEEV